MAVQQLVERRRDTGAAAAPGAAITPNRRDRTKPPQASPPASLVRRRRIVLTLAGLIATATLAALGTGAAMAWAAVGVVSVATGTYLTVLHRNRCLATEREFAQLLGPHPTDLA